MRKYPSAVRPPWRKGRSRGSASLVSKRALLASVRATTSVGTPIMSEARRAATSFWMNSPDGRRTSRGTQAQVGVHLPRVVAACRDLPAAHVDRPQARPNLLDRLVPGEGAQRCDIAIRIQEPPQLFRAEFRERVPDADRPA